MVTIKYKTIRVEEKDHQWLERIRDKLKKRSLGDVIESMINLIKLQKSEGEIK